MKTTNNDDKIDALESENLYMNQSQIPYSGNGLFTAIDIYKDEIIAIFKGNILTDLETKKRAKERND